MLSARDTNGMKEEFQLHEEIKEGARRCFSGSETYFKKDEVFVRLDTSTSVMIRISLSITSLSLSHLLGVAGASVSSRE